MFLLGPLTSPGRCSVCLRTRQLSQGSAMSWDPNIDPGFGLLEEHSSHYRQIIFSEAQGSTTAAKMGATEAGTPSS